MYAAEHAEVKADKPAIVMANSGEVVTYAEYEGTANRVAHLFRESGLRRRDHVAIFMDNDPRMLMAEGGAERTGLYFTCVNSYLSSEEVAYIVNDCEARLVVTSAAKAEVASQLPVLCPNVERWLMVGAGGDPDGPFEDWDDVIARHPGDPIPDEQLGTPMLYSSGTTGRPKGILRPLPDVHPGDNLPIFQGLKTLWRLRDGMTYLSPAPLYHSAPQASVAIALRLGATSVVMEHFDAARYLELVERHRVTHSQVVPTMFSRLLKLPEDVRRAADVSSLEVIIHAAAPCPVPVKEQMIDWFGPILLEYYAATEGNGFTFCDSEDWLAHKGTVGRAIAGELLILDDDGNPCPTGTPGTVWFGGSTNFEYFNDPAKTAESRNAAGDASTVGDVGYVDEEGYLYLTDRKTYMIISGGVNIYPQETENLLITHPKVMDAAVIGVPDEDLGEAVKAVVQPAPDVAAGADLERELIAFCREHLAHFKCPRTIDFQDELPRLPTGKLYKRLLRDRYWGDRATRIV
ncbi:MAG: AMP-dependent synthetase and ligase [Acidimicrobiales bacterium]|nr:AMP-dependent synthetase and ligase [Acidimicrobiales bacterium]